ncbi:unnamed protein product, partial [Effrenium voratum]
LVSNPAHLAMTTDANSDSSESKPGERRAGVQVLEQEEEREPSEEEIKEYAEFLGLDVEKEPDLLWIAKEGVCAPVPAPWKACTENGDDVFYWNFETGESIWDHPADESYRQLLEDKRKEKAAKEKAKEGSGKEEPKEAKPEPKEEASNGDEVVTEPAGKKPDVAKEDLSASVSASIEESFSASFSAESASAKPLAEVKPLAEADKPLAEAVNASTSKSEAEESGALAEAKEAGKPLATGKPLEANKPSERTDKADDPPSAGIGLAGVGLGGVQIGPRGAVGKEPKKIDSLPELEEVDNSTSHSAPPRPKTEKIGGSGGSGSGSNPVAQSDGELSEDFMSDLGSPENSGLLAPNSKERAHSRANSGDHTLDLSISAAADAAESAEVAPGSLEAEVSSLARSLQILRKIRESQQQYLELLGVKVA